MRAALREAIAERRIVAIELQPETEVGPVLVTAAPLRHSRPPDYFRVSFESSGRRSAQPQDRKDPMPGAIGAAGVPHRSTSLLEEEVRILRRELQASLESFEATNEELKASNEEVISINEELQSTNEEL